MLEFFITLLYAPSCCSTLNFLLYALKADLCGGGTYKELHCDFFRGRDFRRALVVNEERGSKYLSLMLSGC